MIQQKGDIMHIRCALVERRRHKRFQVPEGAQVSLRLPKTRMGQIIDISMGGLAYRYVDDGFTRRSSVKFGQLTNEQISSLEYFIENHTSGEV
jgi:hypothetical protein